MKVFICEFILHQIRDGPVQIKFFYLLIDNLLIDNLLVDNLLVDKKGVDKEIIDKVVVDKEG